jgi:hypothetical protein
MSVQSNVPELPPPSAELMLIAALVLAHCRTLPRKERDRFLAEVEHTLGLQEASLNVLNFRPRSENRAVHDAMRQARFWFRQAIAVTLRLAE